MSAPYKHERWICERCGVEGTDETNAREHYDHPAGWKLEGNQHPELDRFDPEHPDKIKGFYWTVDWIGVAIEAAHRFPEGHPRRQYWLSRKGADTARSEAARAVRMAAAT